MIVGFIFASYADSFRYFYIGKNTSIIFYNKLNFLKKNSVNSEKVKFIIYFHIFFDILINYI
jgi:hypothetical protein